MPRGPRGEERPADAIGCVVKVARIATGEIEDECAEPVERQRRGGQGGRRSWLRRSVPRLRGRLRRPGGAITLSATAGVGTLYAAQLAICGVEVPK